MQNFGTDLQEIFVIMLFFPPLTFRRLRNLPIYVTTMRYTRRISVLLSIYRYPAEGMCIAQIVCQNKGIFNIILNLYQYFIALITEI